MLFAASAMLAVSGPLPADAQDVDVDVEVAGLVITDLAVPADVVQGNTLQTVTVNVRNDLPRPLPAVEVRLDGVDNSGPQTLSIPALSSRDVTFNVVPCRSGASTLRSTVTARDGSATLTDTSEPVTIRVATGSTCTASTTVPGGTLSVTTNAGRLANLTAVPLAGLPTPPADMSLPYGAISFTIEDLDVGAAVTVRVTVPGSATDYAKLTADGWVRVPGTVTIGNGVAVTLTDGGVGDADGVANGRIVDPGAVVAQQPPPATDAPTATTSAVTTTTPPSGASPTTVAAPTVPTDPPGTGPIEPIRGVPVTGLPQTGSDPSRALQIAGVLAVAGGAVLLARRVGPTRERK